MRFLFKNTDTNKKSKVHSTKLKKSLKESLVTLTKKQVESNRSSAYEYLFN